MTTGTDGERTVGWAWPLWAAASGILGAISHVITTFDFDETAAASGVGVIADLDFRTYHIGVVAGIMATFCVLAFAAGWRRWVAETGRASLMTELVGLALVAAAGAMLLGYGNKGGLAVYLDGGSDAGMYPAESLLPLYMFDDFGPFIAWYGVAMAALGIAWVALRERTLPRWFGVVALVFALVPFGFLVAIGLPGFPGVIDPLWMVITGVGLALTLRRTAVRSARVAAPAVGAPAVQV